MAGKLFSVAQNPPTLQEIQDYIASNPKYSGVDPETFLAYYTEMGWRDKDGKPVLRWKAKLITWASRNPPKIKDDPMSWTRLVK